MFDSDEIIEIVDGESGDTYFYDVLVEIDDLPSIVDLRQMIDELE